jgi:catechol 2,3-dioxygenase
MNMSSHQEPIFDVAQLAHVEIFSPKPDETLWFFTQLLGMEVSGRSGQSVYLRGYEEFYHHSLKVTEAREAGLGHVGWRTTSPQALERRVKAIEATGLGRGWIDGDLGHGEAYQFTTPDGHLMELMWNIDHCQVEESQKTGLLCRPQKRPDRGVPVRRIDHVNLMAADAGESSKFMNEKLGFRFREIIVDDENNVMGSWISVTNLVHDIAIMRDPSGMRGRLHHVCYWYGYPQNLYDAAELLKDNGIFVEAGPGKHGVSQAFFLYVYEPGGNRIELFGDAGYLIFDPTWEPVVWNVRDVPGKGDVWVGGALPESFWVYGTPVVESSRGETSA